MISSPRINISYELDTFYNARSIVIKEKKNTVRLCDIAILYRVIWIRHSIERSYGKRILVQNVKVCIVLKKEDSYNIYNEKRLKICTINWKSELITILMN